MSDRLVPVADVPRERALSGRMTTERNGGCA
jgi:hypothetical protein